MTDEAALRAARAFALGSEPTRAAPLGEGHIHGTWRIETGAGQDYVLQRLNETVFPDLDAVMANVARVTEHLRARLGSGGQAERRALRLVPTRSTQWLHRDADAGAWRAYVHIADSHSHSTVPSPAVARTAAHAFGAFAAACADLDPTSLAIPLPGFHDFDARYAAFARAVAEDSHDRARAAEDALDLARRSTDTLRDALRDHDLDAQPVRVVHNDCKLNNVLFDATRGADRPEALCVIDLDTVMPGWLAHDFGDLGRAGACREPEDSVALDRVVADPALLEALTEGYLAATRSLITPAERALFPLAGPLITLEAVLRFLTDHLEGDPYYGVQRPGQNLDRARMHQRLHHSLMDSRDVVARIADRA